MGSCFLSLMGKGKGELLSLVERRRGKGSCSLSLMGEGRDEERAKPAGCAELAVPEPSHGDGKEGPACPTFASQGPGTAALGTPECPTPAVHGARGSCSARKAREEPRSHSLQTGACEGVRAPQEIESGDF